MNNMYLIYGFKDSHWYFIRYCIYDNICLVENIIKEIKKSNCYEEIRSLKFDPNSYGQIYL